MTEDKIREWCIKVWPKRWKELAPSSDSRALFVKETIKLKPTEEDLKKWELDIVAQTKFWRQKSKIEKVYGVPRLSQWMKDRRFDDEFIDESAMDLKAKEDAKYCHCGNETLGPKYTLCAKHLPDPMKEMRKRTMIELGLAPAKGESISEWQNRCREQLLANTKSGLVSMPTLDDLYPKSYRRRES
jgi:hypothetical protein